VKYYLNIVLVDEDERRYFKLQEVQFYRKQTKSKRPKFDYPTEAEPLKLPPLTENNNTPSSTADNTDPVQNSNTSAAAVSSDSDSNKAASP
jgi:hypothetical protein